jgi:sugar/nucleoside kinase (ribokinase family)
VSVRVLCAGLATLDAIYLVPDVPPRDGRVVASRFAQGEGGPAATAAVTLAALGVDVSFAGAVGDDEAGRAILAGLERAGVDVSRVVVQAGATSPRSTILVGDEGGWRSIVHHRGTATPDEIDAAGFDWVHVDHAGYGLVRPGGARLSIDGGNPIPGLDLDGVALYAPTEAALADAFGGPAGALAAGAQTVVVTRGAAGSRAWTAGGETLDAPGVAVDAVSTLGAGDVFHGALVAYLAREAPLLDALRAANAAAALSCRALDGRSAIPTLEELERTLS